MTPHPTFLIARTLVAALATGICIADATPGVAGREQAPGLPRLWQVPLPGRGAPAADDTTAYFLSQEHDVVAVELASGQVRWRRATFETEDLLSGAALLVSGDSLVVADYNLLAFDRGTGALRWRFIPTDGFGPGIHLGAISNGAAVAGSPSGRVYAVDVESGALRWSTALGTDDRTTVYAPAADGQFVAAAFTEFSAPPRGGIALLSAENGRVLWKRKFPEPDDPSLPTNWAGGPLFLHDTIVAASGDGNIRGFDLESGDIRWTIAKVSGQLPFPVAADRDFRPLVVQDGVLVSGSATGLIVGYDAETRAERWRYPAVRLGSSAFRIGAAGRLVYVPFLNGQLVAIDVHDGRERWRIGDYSSGFLWPPATSGERILLNGIGDGMLAVRYQP